MRSNIPSKKGDHATAQPDSPKKITSNERLKSYTGTFPPISSKENTERRRRLLEAEKQIRGQISDVGRQLKALRARDEELERIIKKGKEEMGSLEDESWYLTDVLSETQKSLYAPWDHNNGADAGFGSSE